MNPVIISAAAGKKHTREIAPLEQSFYDYNWEQNTVFYTIKSSDNSWRGRDLKTNFANIIKNIGDNIPVYWIDSDSYAIDSFKPFDFQDYDMLCNSQGPVTENNHYINFRKFDAVRHLFTENTSMICSWFLAFSSGKIAKKFCYEWWKLYQELYEKYQCISDEPSLSLIVRDSGLKFGPIPLSANWIINDCLFHHHSKNLKYRGK